VGSGHSARVIRQAILDTGLATRVTSIDPRPRVEVSGLCEEVHRCPVEECPPDLLDGPGENDMLFIDSSHVILPGNDMVALYLHVLPRLSTGVFVHVHDVFVP
jgi:hypothetical protein